MSKYTIKKHLGKDFIYTSIPNGVVFLSIVAAKNKLNKQDKRINELEAKLEAAINLCDKSIGVGWIGGKHDLASDIKAILEDGDEWFSKTVTSRSRT